MRNGWEERPDIERRLLDALFETYRNLANSLIMILNLATVDVPGCDCIMIVL